MSGNKLYPGSSGKSKYYYYDDYYDDYYYDYDYDYDYALQRGVGCLQTFSLLRWFHNTQGWQRAQRIPAAYACGFKNLPFQGVLYHGWVPFFWFSGPFSSPESHHERSRAWTEGVKSAGLQNCAQTVRNKPVRSLNMCQHDDP